MSTEMHHPRLCLSLLLAFLCSLAIAAEAERNVDIFAWPLSASKSKQFLKVSYTATNASIKSHNPPQIPAGEEVVRIGFLRPSGEWSGVATAASNLAPEKNVRLQLHVKQDGELYHVGVKAGGGISQGQGESTKAALSVEVVPILPGPAPSLNKPVVVSADGKPAEEKEPEKTFLQKYWWAIGLFVLMQVVSSGGGSAQEKK